MWYIINTKQLILYKNKNRLVKIILSPNRLKLEPENLPILLTESVNNTTQSRQRICQLSFETFNFSHFCLISQPVLSFLSTGKSTGFCVESGHGVTQFVPVYEGSKVQVGVYRLELAGQDVNDSLEKFANAKGFTFKDYLEKETLADLKEKLCHVAQNYEEEKKKDANELEKTFKLPDGKEIKLGAERFECTEQLFEPETCGKEIDGIIDRAYDRLMHVDPDVRNELYGNIVLAGGNTMMPGFVERFKTQFTKLAPVSAKDWILLHQKIEILLLGEEAPYLLVCQLLNQLVCQKMVIMNVVQVSLTEFALKLTLIFNILVLHSNI
ncbi:actin, putative [Entamoeba invadens IP1]|uniref:Actin, putative n=1 Tax=Entamoeba invadens IP1 TaxID=370355 RepID=A0A0A1U5S8_ENTIV|nr:actin, putative [Entamoeba invadens IP1]ELP89663.1 actin, putative [Entamoeba invadens IP1]|eukprot:XP_004256434.1 actin, putative [Entamoeba invadens IP1]